MANRYDLVFDGRRIAEGLPAPIDLSAGISFIALNSGRWGRERDVESYFDDLLIYVEPGASAGVTRAARTEGGARS